MILNRIKKIIDNIYEFYIYGKAGIKFNGGYGDSLIELIKLKLERIYTKSFKKKHSQYQTKSTRVCIKLCNRILNKQYYFNRKNITDFDEIAKKINRDLKLLYQILINNYDIWG